MNFNLERLKYKKFQHNNPKILLITSKYFLIGEFITALRKLNIEFDTLLLGENEYLTQDFINLLKEKISSFKPDFTFTINHLGIDREGILMTLFEKIEMPILSWYVDNPNLIIKNFKKNVSDFCTILVWDRDNIQDMKEIGFKNVFYMPLGTDPDRFKKINLADNPFKSLKTDISFVGKTMIDQVKKTFNQIRAPESFKKFYKKIAVEFIETSERSVENFIKDFFPEIYKLFQLLDEESKTYFETTVTWEATRIYRYKCIKEIVPFKPLLIGDKNWRTYFRDKINYFPEVNYYEDLPYIYNLSEINFNTTSLQMKNAVNQRIFDVPACQGFIITDYRKQMEDLFEIGEEVICYRNIDEIQELVKKYLHYKDEREKVIKKAYNRVIKEHKYTDRALQIINIARKVYS